MTMSNLQYRPAPDPHEFSIEDRLVFPKHRDPVRLRLSATPASTSVSAYDPMHDTGEWMSAAIDHVQDRLNTVRNLLSEDDDGPWAA
jgi:hypothetical protein